MTCRAESKTDWPTEMLSCDVGYRRWLGGALLTVHRDERRIKALSDTRKDIYIAVDPALLHNTPNVIVQSAI